MGVATPASKDLESKTASKKASGRLCNNRVVEEGRHVVYRHDYRGVGSHVDMGVAYPASIDLEVYRGRAGCCPQSAKRNLNMVV